ncbi:hypothetical protein LCGC14_1259060 [marine sediment metagenome]|uniref:Uncharacterized protein n=1 Tax=marine sediment metagenome TaxID=412755 RepID=A0A0F9L1A6_9ZZZZ
MAKRSTRRKILDADEQAVFHLKAAQRQLVRIAAMADDQSGYIDNNLPPIIAAVEFIIDTLDKFSEKL